MVATWALNGRLRDMHPLRLSMLLTLMTPACGVTDGPTAGQETGPCLQGECFSGLMCLSDICVGPDDDGSGSAATSNGAGTGGPNSGSGPSSNTNPGSGPSSNTSPDDSAGSASATDGSEGPGPTGSPTGNPTGNPTSGCSALDILVVVDNSGSMADEQGRLGTALPAFLTEVVSRTGSEDHHVMVVDTDRWVFAGCETLCQFTPSCGGLAEDYVCGVTTPEPCEDIRGAGVTYPKGVDSSGVDCGFPGLARYATLSDPAALDQVDCAARVGTASTDDPELPMESMIAAVDSNSSAAECNGGFSRDGAPLVVVFITDEEEGIDDSAGVPAGWRVALVAARGGNEESIAVLGLIGDPDQPGAQCQPTTDEGGAEASPRLREFVLGFGDRGIASSVCAADYGPAFDELLNVIDGLCQ